MLERLLLVEDDQPLAAMTAEFLETEGFAVAVEHRGDEAAARILQTQPALVILDVMLPGLDGFALCRRIRDDYAGLILMMTALDEDHEQLTGFTAGADDYVVKPVDPKLLAARIRALLRRRGPQPGQALTFGTFRVDLQRREASLDGQALPFTSGEFELLSRLAASPGVPIDRETILRRLRGLEYDGFNRSIDMRVSRLRKKLATLGCPVTIKTINAQGYMFCTVDADTDHAQ
ncbi:response regulator transcription factor [Andreprevotia chitinilytica]|uniref:response regulator transcription factor n=1 Tax=Andreprevotia chitinilytica TaxID=396808 RepID=UPI000557ADBF|nr:response regulator transcription factor [Andreprevotia chitinilytica]